MLRTRHDCGWDYDWDDVLTRYDVTIDKKGNMLVIARDKNIIILAIQSAEDKHVITRALLEDEREKKIGRE